MHEIGGLVWVLLVIIGVVSSIVQSSRRSAAQRRVQPPQTAARQMPVAQRPPIRPQPQFDMREELASIMAQMAAQSQPVQPPPKPPPPPVAPTPVAAPPPPPIRPVPAVHSPVARTEKLFGQRSSLVRAVIAAEVLGKPLALRDEYPQY